MMAKGPDAAPEAPITRDDLQRSFAEVQQGFKKQVDARKPKILTIAAGAGVLVVVIIFLLGRRSGKKATTFVEIRRV